MNPRISKNASFPLSKKAKSFHFSFFSLFYGLSIVLSIFFEQYNSFIPGVYLGEIFLIILSIFMFVRNSGKIKLKATIVLVLFYFFSLLFSLLSLSVGENSFLLETKFEVLSRWIRYFACLIFSIFIFDNSRENDKIMALSMYRWLCIIVSFYAIFQFIFYRLLNIYLPVNILPFPFANGVTTEDAILTASKWSSSYFRAFGIFTEPSYLIKYLLPGLALSFYGWNKGKMDVLLVFAASAAIILSVSAQGLFILAFTILVCLLCYLRKHRDKAFLVSALLIVGVIAAAIVGFGSGLANRAFARLISLGSSNMDDSSAMRIFRGFYIWKELPLFNKIFGVGMGNSANFIFEHSVKTPFDTYSDTALALGYMNGISLIMVECGFLPSIILIAIYIQLIKKSNWAGKVIALQMFFLMISSCFSILSLLSIFYMFFCSSYSKPKKHWAYQPAFYGAIDMDIRSVSKW